MSFKTTDSKPAIKATNLSKRYQLYQHPKDRLKQFLWPQRWLGPRLFFRELWALHEINLTVMPGEVVGIVGQNGSGKSTLLQLVCGTLTPTNGEVQVNGRIAALLELGAGFNPEFSGRENIFMSSAIMGLSQSEITGRIEDIIDFSGVRDFIDQPVKTYSSGMYVRLAFSVAINVDPDILVIDEALSVGDGAFARKSFARIMQMRDAGKTILFCSHSLFQVESLCTRTIWINHGRVMMDGESAGVVTAYQAFLDGNTANPASDASTPFTGNTVTPENNAQPSGTARLVKIELQGKNTNTQHAIITSGESGVQVSIAFASDPSLPCPNVAMTLQTPDGRTITSAATWEDQFMLQRTAEGIGKINLQLDQIPLLKGDYLINIYLMCERGLHIYDAAVAAATLQIKQSGRLQGYFSIPHRWENTL
ncbi:MAG: ABC transporter ATP-binding protein [Nitrosomonas sp.]|uniref:ABC transporter ATP-binding protein n=1 Tax=Nitrosomonas sp. TaxID=42353 RepID=UPI001DD65623|nr:ABC transporter ATP-binding protein [Nitrosomonas sp.]MBX9895518.1 ABC transporter ATP-binding protein [Nitrosomonas sp.]